MHTTRCVSSLRIRAATWSLFREVMSGSLLVISATNAATSELEGGEERERGREGRRKGGREGEREGGRKGQRPRDMEVERTWM